MSRRAVVAVVSCLPALLLLFLAPAGPAAGADKKKAKLAEAEIPKELQPRPFTLQGKDIPLAKALAELARQTGNPVEDRRQVKENSPIKLDVQGVTFWQGLDAIARAADARVSLYERDGRIALVDGPHVVLPVSYQGLFRVTLRRIAVIQDLEPESHFCDIYLEFAWEPRFRPLFMEAQPDSLVAQDDKGRALEVPESGKGMGAVGGRVAAVRQLRLKAPRRAATKLAVLKGKLRVVGPSQMLTFTFDKLGPVTTKDQVRRETQQGVSVSLRRLTSEGEKGEQIWTASILLEYPPEGPKFESFQSWIVNNQVFLVREKDGLRQEFPPNLGYNTEDETDTKAIIVYRFGEEPDRNRTLGNFSDWKLVYRTPGRIAAVPIPFEFKDLPLP